LPDSVVTMGRITKRQSARKTAAMRAPQMSRQNHWL
jgi:hypothetical protein